MLPLTKGTFLQTLIFKNGLKRDITFSGKGEIFTKSPLALFWMGILVRNAELLQTLTNKNDHLELIQVAIILSS